jgi:hypothetical protein
MDIPGWGLRLGAFGSKSGKITAFCHLISPLDYMIGVTFELSPNA